MTDDELAEVEEFVRAGNVLVGFKISKKTMATLESAKERTLLYGCPSHAVAGK